MITPDQVPDAAADSLRAFFHTRGDAQRAIASMLNAWPGMKENPSWDLRTHERRTEFVLPVHQGAPAPKETWWDDPDTYGASA